jgi:DNA-binding XRE family transcriptional regulator
VFLKGGSEAMVFIRRKKMNGKNGKHYYQLVRNDRVAGKHRQKVLCHLGVNDSIDAAIADTKRQVDHLEEAAASREEEAHRKEAELKEIYGDDVEIMDEDQARMKQSWLTWDDPRRYRALYYTPYYPTYFTPDYSADERDRYFLIEEWEDEKQRVDLSIAYHDAMRSAEGYRLRTTRTRARLDKLLECQRKYFQQQEQAAERERDELRGLLTHSAYQATRPSSDTPVEVTRAQEPDRTESPKVNRKPSGHKIDGRKVQVLREDEWLDQREDEWLDQRELAERAGVSRVTISEIERGLRPFPHPDTVLALANALGVAPEVLATRD